VHDVEQDVHLGLAAVGFGVDQVELVAGAVDEHHPGAQVVRVTGLIDYQQRREALSSWTLEPDIWQRMATHLPILPGHRTSISDDRKRIAVCVCVCIWTRVTEGELEFAPCPPHIAHDSELRSTWSRQRHNICHWLRQTETRDGLPYYRALKPLLDTHAEQMAVLFAFRVAEGGALTCGAASWFGNAMRCRSQRSWPSRKPARALQRKRGRLSCRRRPSAGMAGQRLYMRLCPPCHHRLLVAA
jgi:hypothetical protein